MHSLQNNSNEVTPHRGIYLYLQPKHRHTIILKYIYTTLEQDKQSQNNTDFRCTYSRTESNVGETKADFE